MKHAIIFTLLIAAAFTAQAQNKTEIQFGVSGVCGMCEARIEKALDVPGVIMADWNVDTKKATVAFKTKKLTEQQVHQLVADAGHDTDRVKAKDEVYAKIHGCCKYRDGASCSGGKDHDHDHDHEDQEDHDHDDDRRIQ